MRFESSVEVMAAALRRVVLGISDDQQIYYSFDFIRVILAIISSYLAVGLGLARVNCIFGALLLSAW